MTQAFFRAPTTPSRIIAALATLGLLATAGLASSQQRGRAGGGTGRAAHRGQQLLADPAKTLERLDKDGDGVITPSDVPDGERGERLLRRLERIDVDGDGRVTLQELEQARAAAEERRAHGGPSVS